MILHNLVLQKISQFLPFFFSELVQVPEEEGVREGAGGKEAGDEEGAEEQRVVGGRIQ